MFRSAFWAAEQLSSEGEEFVREICSVIPVTDEYVVHPDSFPLNGIANYIQSMFRPLRSGHYIKHPFVSILSFCSKIGYLPYHIEIGNLIAIQYFFKNTQGDGMY